MVSLSAMLRNRIIRALLLLAAFASGLAACVLFWLAGEEPWAGLERLRGVYRFDVTEEHAEAELENARLVLHRRLEYQTTDVGTWTERGTDVGFDCWAWSRPDEYDPRESLDPEFRSLLETRGDLQFLPTAEEGDVARLGGSFSEESERAQRWRREHPDRSIEDFNRSPREQGGPIPGLRWYPIADTSDDHDVELVPVLVQEPKWTFTAPDLSSAGPSEDELGYPAVQFEIAEHRRDEFGDFSESLVGKALAIVFSGEVITCPIVQDRLPGTGIIDGGPQGFTDADVRQILIILGAGELPDVPVLVSADRTPITSGLPRTLWSGLAATLLVICVTMIALFVMSFQGRVTGEPE